MLDPETASRPGPGQIAVAIPALAGPGRPCFKPSLPDPGPAGFGKLVKELSRLLTLPGRPRLAMIQSKSAGPGPGPGTGR